MALATLLVVGAGLFVASLRNVRAIDLGLNIDHVLYVRFDGRADRTNADSSAAASALANYQAMLERVRRVPGVANATLTAGEPFASGWAISIRRRGAPPLVEGTPVPFARAVGTEYFETMGTRLVRGRFFTAADHSRNAHVAIIDEATARQYWPDGDPLDPCVYLGDDKFCTQIVGVVANTVLWQVTGDKGHIVYLPIESAFSPGISMMEVRTEADPTQLIPAVRQAILSVSPNLPWVDITPLSHRYEDQLVPWQLGASMFAAFGLLALGLAAVGLYGLLSYVVAQRTHEIGVRKALGAPHDVSPRDPLVMAVGASVLVLVAIVACLAPARRAARVDPVIALRAE